MDKIEKLASITTSEFIKALVQVIEKEGFVDVNVDNNAIVATLKSMLSETPHCFIVLEQKLSGTTNIDDIVNDIVRTQNKYSANTTIISRSYISKGFMDRVNDSVKNLHTLVETVAVNDIWSVSHYHMLITALMNYHPTPHRIVEYSYILNQAYNP